MPLFAALVTSQPARVAAVTEFDSWELVLSSACASCQGLPVVAPTLQYSGTFTGQSIYSPNSPQPAVAKVTFTWHLAWHYVAVGSGAWTVAGSISGTESESGSPQYDCSATHQAGQLATVNLASNVDNDVGEAYASPNLANIKAWDVSVGVPLKLTRDQLA